MKKLVLNKTTFSGGEVLSRAQLKKVLGGTESTTTKHECKGDCQNGNDCKDPLCPTCSSTSTDPTVPGACTKD